MDEKVLQRINSLRHMLDEAPDDPFLIYALALELKPLDAGESLSLFEALLQNHPDYLPTYYHAAAALRRAGQRLQALQVYEKGMALARQQNDMKTLAELQNARTNLELGEEEEE